MQRFILALFLSAATCLPLPDQGTINGGEFHDFNKVIGKRDSGKINGGEFHDFDKVIGKRDSGKINGGEFHNFDKVIGKRDTGTINGGEFHNFDKVIGKRDTGVINGGEFHNFDKMIEKRAACRVNGGDFTGLSAAEKANIRANCKVVGGDFGDRMARSFRSKEKKPAVDDEPKADLEEETEPKLTHAQINKGSYSGFDSVANLTGKKDNNVEEGVFHHFNKVIG